MALIRSEEGWEDAQICPVSLSHDLGDGTGEGWAVATCMAWDGPLPAAPVEGHVQKSSNAAKTNRSVDYELEKAVKLLLREERGCRKRIPASKKQEKPIQKAEAAQQHGVVRRIGYEAQEWPAERGAECYEREGKRIKVTTKPDPSTARAVAIELYSKRREREESSAETKAARQKKWGRRGFYVRKVAPRGKLVRTVESAKHKAVRIISSEARERTGGRKAVVCTGSGKGVRWVESGSQPKPKAVGAVARDVYAKGYERKDESDEVKTARMRKWTRRGFHSVPFQPTKTDEHAWHEGPMPRSLLSKLAGVRKALWTLKDPPPP